MDHKRRHKIIAKHILSIAEPANQLLTIRSDKILYSDYVNYRKDD